jgi:cob(I)alamin adenosyltransferase
LARYVKDNFQPVTPAMTTRLEKLAEGLEQELGTFKDWALPGASGTSALLDVARAICRRAERQACGLAETQHLPNREVLVYLNRLSDVLWLLARWAERQVTLGEGPVLV